MLCSYMFGILGSDSWCKLACTWLYSRSVVKCQRLESSLRASKLEMQGVPKCSSIFICYFRCFVDKFLGTSILANYFQASLERGVCSDSQTGCPLHKESTTSNLNPKLFPGQGAIIHSAETHHTDLLVLSGPASPVPVVFLRMRAPFLTQTKIGGRNRTLHN